jgi:cytidylate kinase
VAERVIAIDGPSGSGKSTTARAVARALGFAHLDSGALYRAITLAALDAGEDLRGDALTGLAGSLPVRLAIVDDAFRPEVAGVDVSDAIRDERVTARVSAVAAMPAVRQWVNEALRAAVERCPQGVVVDGRDIGTVVFAEAPLKIFLTASPEERARRRSLQTARPGGAESEVGAVQEDMARRDQADRTRAVAPLAVARDAVQLDTTGMEFGEQVGRIVALARQVF